MSIPYRKKLLLADVEETYGEARVLTGANGFLAADVQINPLAGENVERTVERAYYGNNAQIPVNTHQTLSFKVEFAPNVSVVPAWGVLLRACGMAETIVPGANGYARYTPISGGEESLTALMAIDKETHSLTGARGTFGIELGSNQIPYFNFTFLGLFNKPETKADNPVPDYSNFPTPKISNNANVPVFNLLGLAGFGLTSFAYNHANENTHRELIGIPNNVTTTDRAPSGSLTVDMRSYAEVNFIQEALEQNEKRIRITQNGHFAVPAGAAPAKLDVEMLLSTVSNVQTGETNGITQTSMDYRPLPGTGNDELTITNYFAEAA